MDKRFFWETLPAAVCAVVIGSVTVGSLSRNERRTARAVIVEQNKKIKSLQEIVDGKTTADAAPCACPDASSAGGVTADCPAPVEAKCAQGKDFDAGASETGGNGDVTSGGNATAEQLLAANLSACTQGAKSVEMLTQARKRNTCEEAKQIHGIIDSSNAACDGVIKMSASDAQKKIASDAKASNDAFHKHPRISPPPCGLE